MDIGEVIATRKLYIANDRDREVVVRMGVPREFPDFTGYYCPYQITGAGDDKVRYAAGIDAFQAIELAFRMIGAELKFKYQRRVDGQLCWAGDDSGGLGFPVPEGNYEP